MTGVRYMNNPPYSHHRRSIGIIPNKEPAKRGMQGSRSRYLGTIRAFRRQANVMARGMGYSGDYYTIYDRQWESRGRQIKLRGHSPGQHTTKQQA